MTQESMYPCGMVWVILEFILVLAGVWGLNRYLRNGIDKDLSMSDPLDDLYRKAEETDEDDGLLSRPHNSASQNTKSLPKP